MDGILISQIANSNDLEQINQEVIESVKFRFIEKNFLKKLYSQNRKENLLDINGLQKDQEGNYLYDSEEELLNDILKNENVKHYRQLRYLSSRHKGAVLKLRFVLNPFSFVFLITGNEQYYIILETLNTEEATYIWEIGNNKQYLLQELKLIDQDINIIRNKGRQFFLENHPKNFSRIIHNYSDERKGFILWKDLLEERII